MAEVSTLTYSTLVDVTKRMAPGGGIDTIAEVLKKTNPILDDLPFVEGNLPTGHRYTSRTALPSLSWRRFNQGIAASKSATEQFEESIGMLEGMSKVDVDLAALNGNTQEFRFSEDKAFIDAMNLEVATALFYYSTTTAPEKITGLTPRLNSLSGGDAAAQVLSCPYGSGSASGSDQTSVWLVGWGADSIFGIYPKGSVAGLQSEDLGKNLVKDRSGTNEYLAYVTRWQWKLGLCVRDYRYLSRLCNIDTSSTTIDPTASGSADIAMGMLSMQSKIFSMSNCNPVYYMNRWTHDMLNKQMVKRQANWLEWVDRGGRKLQTFYGVPIVIVDAITSTEAVVS